jgi:iron complex outermembrane receptor protein
MTLFASRNTNEPYDPADIDLTAIPKFKRYTVNPKLFVDLTGKTSLNVGVNFTTEDRIGGDVHFIQGNGDATHSYFEENDSERYSTQFAFTHRFSESTSLNVRNSFNYFDRLLQIPQYIFDGTQNSSFTELNVATAKERSEWIGGVNLWTDDFTENRLTSVPLRDYSQITMGAFIQNTSSVSEKVSFEAGLRADHVLDYGFAFLPRLSILYKANEKFSSRVGGGIGYKAPTIITEESERIQYENVLPISEDKNTLEKSYGTNWDLNYRTELGDVGFSINHLFFYTHLKSPLALNALDNGTFEFVNLSGYTDSKGTETNLKLEYGDFKLFIGYTYTDTRIHDQGTVVQNPLTAKHRLNNVLMYEVEEKWKIGLEGYYFSPQRLSDNTYGKSYWICGLMMERLWERFSLFLNFENFLDARQTRFDTIYTGPITDPVFRDIYAPVDGFVINGGIKLNLSANE